MDDLIAFPETDPVVVCEVSDHPTDVEVWLGDVIACRDCVPTSWVKARDERRKAL